MKHRALAALSCWLLLGCGFPFTPIVSAGAARGQTVRPDQSYWRQNVAVSAVFSSDSPLLGLDGALEERPAGALVQGGLHGGYASLPLPFQRMVGIEAVLRADLENLAIDPENRRCAALGAARVTLPVRLYAGPDPWTADRSGAPMVLLAPFAEGFASHTFHTDHAETGILAGLSLQLELWSRISP